MTIKLADEPIEGEGDTPSKKATIYDYDDDAPPPPELRFFSTPQGTNVMDTTDYDYEAVAGGGITVFILDAGVWTRNPDFEDLPGGYRWLWPMQDFWEINNNGPYVEDDYSGHGTCMMS